MDCEFVVFASPALAGRGNLLIRALYLARRTMPSQRERGMILGKITGKYLHNMPLSPAL